MTQNFGKNASWVRLRTASAIVEVTALALTFSESEYQQERFLQEKQMSIINVPQK